MRCCTARKNPRAASLSVQVSALIQAKMLQLAAPHPAQRPSFSATQVATLSVTSGRVPCLCPRECRKVKFNLYLIIIPNQQKITIFKSFISFSLSNLTLLLGIKTKMAVLLKGIHTTVSVYIVNKIYTGGKTLSIKILRQNSTRMKELVILFPQFISHHLPLPGHHRVVTVWVRKAVWLCGEDTGLHLRDRAQP